MKPEFEHDLEQCLTVLSKGGVIMYPTDTIWGIGCDATNKKAVARVFNIKLRSELKSMIVLLDDVARLSDYVNKIPAIALDLLEKVNSPMTIIYPGARNLAPNVIAQDKTIAIRIVKDDFLIKLISEFGKPIVSSSANISGQPNPIIFKEIDPYLLEQVDYTCLNGRDDIRSIRPSTLVKITGEWEYEIIRD